MNKIYTNNGKYYEMLKPPHKHQGYMFAWWRPIRPVKLFGLTLGWVRQKGKNDFLLDMDGFVLFKR